MWSFLLFFIYVITILPLLLLFSYSFLCFISFVFFPFIHSYCLTFSLSPPFLFPLSLFPLKSCRAWPVYLIYLHIGELINNPQRVDPSPRNPITRRRAGQRGVPRPSWRQPRHANRRRHFRVLCFLFLLGMFDVLCLGSGLLRDKELKKLVVKTTANQVIPRGLSRSDAIIFYSFFILFYIFPELFSCFWMFPLLFEVSKHVQED